MEQYQKKYKWEEIKDLHRVLNKKMNNKKV